MTEPQARTRKVDTIASLAEHYGIKDMGVRQAECGAQSVEQEYQSYVNGNLLEEGSDPLKFWEVCSHCPLQPTKRMLIRHSQMKRKTFPTIFRIAMDYLPIQASAVPCERIFSSSAETDTKKRNRISPTLMEALQMLKFHLKKDRLNFTKGWATSHQQLLEDEPDEPGTQNALPIQIVDDSYLDRALTAINQEEGHGIEDHIDVIPLPVVILHPPAS
jgi:hypothetical protein